jgi:predicted RNA-binding Zn-ribbon protein involved in translation (DUF1610 family)
MRKPIISADEFAERLSKSSNGRISIVKETYTGTHKKVTAYCNVHKIYFEVSQAKKLTSKEANCPECIKDKRWDKVYESFINTYGNRFSYDKLSYCGYDKLMKVHCNNCGTDFEITPAQHLKYNNGGCPQCQETKIAYCMKCGKMFYINRCANNIKNVYCDSCKKDLNIIQSKSHLKCPFCGSFHKRGERCKNQLCREHHTRDWYKNLIPFGFDYSKIGTIDYMEEYYKAMCVLLIEYYDNMLSPRQIYEKYNCSEYINSDVTIKNVIKSAGFKVRNRSEATKNAI